jgi:hypothetical protein
MNRNKKIHGLAFLASIALTAAASAASMTYTFSGTFAGTLNGTAFNAPLTISTTADPTTMTTRTVVSGSTTTKYHSLTQSTIADIQGIGQVTITRSPSNFFMMNSVTFGISTVTTGYSISDSSSSKLFMITFSSVPSTSLASPGVYSGNSNFSGSTAYSTTGGDLRLTSSTNPVTLTIAEAVPEPSSFALLGFAAAGLLLRRKR